MAEQENTETGTPEYTETEQKALEQGWVPKEDWSGEGKWRDAESFLDRGELFGKIDAQNREIKSTRQALQALQQHYAKMSEVEYKRALETLKKEKKEALLENDADAVLDADEKIAALREGVRQAPVQQVVDNTPHPEFQAWVNKNSWYTSSTVMAAAADQLGRELAAQGKSPSEVLREVEKEIKKEFAHKFTNPNRDKAGAVEGTSSSGGGGRAERVQLTEVEEQVMKKLVGAGVLTKEAYIADIRKQRERQ